MPEKFIDFKALVLKNNCPECYSNDGLRLKFSQKIIETTFYKSITSEIEHELTCENCNSIIYPVQWTDDIEQVVDYQKKAFTPKKTSTYLKSMFWLIIVSVIFVATIIFFTVFYTKL
ncbi:hypothetical protein [Flavisericum labens]|uniref:hypothetical protein n=1 Tax=Flavisericum labens TaxID=3377112 RepID=UPI00387AD6A9